MRGLLVSLMFAVAGCASTPARAHNIAYDPAPLQQCIASANASASALLACKGAGANPCIAAEGDATMMMALCWDREARTWGEAMDAALARLIGSAPAHAEALRASQQAWSTWLGAECGYRAALYEGGSGAQVEQVTCAAGLTADRVIMLSQTGDQL